MNKQMYWGIAALIIVLIAAGGFMYWQWSSVQQLKEELAQEVRELEAEKKPVAENKLPPAAPGKKWVPHGDHFHQVPIDAPDVWQGGTHKTDASDQSADPASFTISAFEGKSLQDKVAASDAVPKYAELKAMTQEELRILMETSYAKAKTFDAEVDKRIDAWTNAPIGSDEEKRLKAAAYAILREQFVHNITGSKAFEVFQWRSILHLQENPLPNFIIVPIPEPFDP